MDETETYMALAAEVGIPKVLWFGDEQDYKVLVFELLGPSLQDLLDYCGGKFSLKTILLIADQAIARIARIHRRYLHRDIKPDNFVMGTGKQGNVLYTIDFGLARELPVRQDRPRGNAALCGTVRYASINSHKGYELSWGDDLESLGYMFVYFARGSLPWQGLRRRKPEVDEDEGIKKLKMELSGQDLCRDCLPDEFAEFIEYARSLGFQKKPDYAYLRRLFRRRFRAEGFKNDKIYDWTIKRFDEIHGDGQ